MKHLIVMRHAKAERGEGKPDYDRALDPRGWSEGERIGTALEAAKRVPDLVICSAARRTRETFAALLPHFAGDCRAEFRRALYEAETNDLRDAVRGAPGTIVLLIGHNPAIQGLAVMLAGSHPGAALLKTSFPPAQAAIFDVGFALDTVRLERVIGP